MEKFSDRLNASWNSASVLKRLLDDFFEDDERFPIKSLNHLYCWLNTDFVDIEKKKNINSQVRNLLEAAEKFCECWVIERGFGSDRSFARWYLERYHGRDLVSREMEDHGPSQIIISKLDVSS